MNKTKPNILKNMDEKLIHVSTIAGAHGVKGLLRLKVHAQDASLSDGKLYTKDGNIVDVLLKNSHGKGFYLASIDGVDSKEAADALKGAELFCNKDRLKDAGDGEYYHVDLIGLDVVSADGEKVGKLINVCNFGAGDLLEIKPPESLSFFLPFDEKYTIGVDIAKGEVIVSNWKDFE